MSDASPSPSAYTFVLASDDMSPQYERGHTIMSDPEREVKPGKSVVIWYADKDRAPIVRVLIEQLPNGLIVETRNPCVRERLSELDINAVHGVAGCYRME